MKFLLTIGCTTYALRSHNLAATVVKALAEATLVEKEFSKEKERYVYVPKDDDGYHPRVELSVAQDSDFVIPKPSPKPVGNDHIRRQIAHRSGQLQLPASTSEIQQ